MKTIIIAALCCFFASVVPVGATILFASGEDTGFTLIGTAVGATASYASRSGFARNTTTTVAAFNSTTVADPPASRFQTPTFTSVSTVWIHGVFAGNVNGNATTSNQQALLVRSPDGVSRIVIRQTGTAGTVKASKRNAAGTITDLATATGTFPNSAATVLFDLEIVYGCTSGDVVSLWLNGTQVINFTGASICTDAATQLNQVEFASMNGGGSGAVSNGGGTGWSEIIIADSDTRGMALWTLNPVASGNTQSWTPNTVANVNKAVIDDTSNVSTGSSNALSEWTTPTTFPAGSWNVLAVVQEARALVGTTGPQHFEWLVRVAGADNSTGSVAPTTSFSNFSNQIWANNPNTSTPWAVSDIVAGFNLGIESLP